MPHANVTGGGLAGDLMQGSMVNSMAPKPGQLAGYPNKPIPGPQSPPLSPGSGSNPGSAGGGGQNADFQAYNGTELVMLYDYKVRKVTHYNPRAGAKKLYLPPFFRLKPLMI